MSKAIQVRKKNGEVEAYDRSKLEASLRNSGATESQIKEVADHIQKELKHNITTDWIYKHAFEELKKIGSRPSSFRYSLRRAIADLGPSGFPFEQYVGQLFTQNGYQVKIGQKTNGKCVVHEIDLIAENDTEIVTAELKFHNKHNLHSDLKTVLYVRERYRDIQDSGFYGDKKARPMLITNTKFTSNAIDYATCSGLELLGWNYPVKGDGLHDIIQNARIHPITAIGGFNKREVKKLIEAGFVTCQDIKRNGGRDALNTGIINKKKLDQAWQDIEMICG